MKPEIRILGIDDASFDKDRDKTVLVIGTFFRGGLWLDGVVSTTVTVDGDDATARLAEMITRSKFHPQIQCIMLDGIAVGGFNVVDITKLASITRIPVIVVMRDYPDFALIHSTLAMLGKEDKIPLLKKAGEITAVGKIHIQIAGIELERAREYVQVASTRSDIPEPIRVAHLIGQGVIMGESRGRA